MRKSLSRTTSTLETQTKNLEKHRIPMFEDIFDRNEGLIDNILSSRTSKIKCVVPISGGKERNPDMVMENEDQDKILRAGPDVNEDLAPCNM